MSWASLQRMDRKLILWPYLTNSWASFRALDFFVPKFVSHRSFPACHSDIRTQGVANSSDWFLVMKDNSKYRLCFSVPSHVWKGISRIENIWFALTQLPAGWRTCDTLIPLLYRCLIGLWMYTCVGVFCCKAMNFFPRHRPRQAVHALFPCRGFSWCLKVLFLRKRRGCEILKFLDRSWVRCEVAGKIAGAAGKIRLRSDK